MTYHVSHDIILKMSEDGLFPMCSACHLTGDNLNSQCIMKQPTPVTEAGDGGRMLPPGTRMMLEPAPARPDLDDLVRQAVARYEALGPLDRAIHDMEQRRSFVRGLRSEDRTAEETDALLDRRPEFVVLNELRRLQQGGDVGTHFQSKAWSWACRAFGPETAGDVKLRALRFIEEAIELVQACALDSEDIRMMTHIVYSRPPGDVAQEVGGVEVTLAVLCAATGTLLRAAADRELARVHTPEVMQKVRNRQASKPKPGDGRLVVHDRRSPVWKPITTAPLDGRFVAMRGASGYHGTPYRLKIAQYEVSRAKAAPTRWLYPQFDDWAWRDHGGDHLTDDGAFPDAWCELTELGL